MKKTITSLKTNNIILNLLIFNFIIFNLLIFDLQSVNAQMFWNQACQFAGTSNSYVAVPNSNTINITGSFSFEAWINPSSIAGLKGIIAKGGVLGTDLEYGIRLLSITRRISLITNGNERLISRASNSIPINKWTHVAGTYNTATNVFRIFINGILDTASIVAGAAPPSNTDSLFIGISGSATPYSGQMDEVRLWNKELSAAEVTRNFRTSLGATGGVYNGLIMSITFQGNQSLATFATVDHTENNNSGFNRGVTGVDQRNRPYLTIMPNESVELDGTDDYLVAVDALAFSPTTAITLECWVYPRLLGSFIFLTKGTNYRVGYNGSQIVFVISNNLFTTGTALSLNRWSHLAFTYSALAGKYFLYLNGELRSSANINAGNIINGTDSLYIGGSPTLGDFNGFIDEVRISHYAKSQQEINDYLYQSIDFINEPNQLLMNIVFNLDGLSTSGTDGAPRLFFRNNARFSHPGTIANQPVSPLNRNDISKFSKGYYKKTSNKRIPSAGTIGSIIDSTIINLNATVTDVNLFVALNHTNSSTLDIVLVGPNNDSVKVFDSKITTSADENIITIFNDQADSSLINNRYSSFSPIIKPQNNMNSVFSGDNANGRWKLIVRDEGANDTGFLYAWGIQLNNLNQRQKDLDLTVVMQGFYNSSTNLMIPDTMRVYVRNGTSPFAIVDSSKSVLNSAGLGLFSFGSLNVSNNQQYYIQLKHRNSIETWSNFFISFVNDETNYSFINVGGAAFGSNQIQADDSPVRFAIYGGDVNQDRVIDLNDVLSVYNAAGSFSTGYVINDVNGDNTVDLNDILITYNNSAAFVTAVRP